MNRPQQKSVWLLARTTLFALLWWLLTEGETSSWWFGIPVVLLATGLSMLFTPPSHRSLIGWLRFIPFFIGQSLKGGLDVAWRALHPTLPIAPRLVDYPLRLSSEEAQVFMTNITSLLPGTLGARLKDDCLQVHVLDGHGDFRTELGALEEKVATLFRIRLEQSNGGL